MCYGLNCISLQQKTIRTLVIHYRKEQRCEQDESLTLKIENHHHHLHLFYCLRCFQTRTITQIFFCNKASCLSWARSQAWVCFFKHAHIRIYKQIKERWRPAVPNVTNKFSLRCRTNEPTESSSLYTFMHIFTPLYMANKVKTLFVSRRSERLC